MLRGESPALTVSPGADRPVRFTHTLVDAARHGKWRYSRRRRHPITLVVPTLSRTSTEAAKGRTPVASKGLVSLVRSAEIPAAAAPGQAVVVVAAPLVDVATVVGGTVVVAPCVVLVSSTTLLSAADPDELGGGL